MSKPKELTLKHAAWSISKAKMATRCSKQFQWKYVERRKGDSDVLLDDGDSRVGIAVHALLENCVLTADLEKIRTTQIEKNKLTITEVENLDEMYNNITYFRDILTNFCKKRVVDTEFVPPNLLGDLVRRQKIFPEIRFGITDDFEVTGFFDKNCFFRGVIDLIILTKDGGAIIVDHKSSSFPTLKHYRTQLMAYRIAVCAMFPEVKWVQCGIHFITLKQILWDKVVTRKNIENQESDKLLEHLDTAAEHAEEDKINVGNHCKWCSYVSSCKKIRKRRRKTKTKKEE